MQWLKTGAGADSTVRVEWFKAGNASPIFLPVGQDTIVDHTPAGPNQYPPTMVPATVYHALSVELYFKCLIQLESGSPPPQGHSLADLYKKLATATRDALKQVYAEVSLPVAKADTKFAEITKQPSAAQFDNALAASSDAFTTWRYFHEKKMGGGIVIPRRIAVAARRTILKTQPTWEPLVARLFPLRVKKRR
jgi:hypothetical protein